MPYPANRRLMIIGNGKTAADACQVALQTPGVSHLSWLHHERDSWSVPHARRLLAQHSGLEVHTCVHASDPDAQRLIRAWAPDLVLSANNFDLFTPDTIALPRDGIVNFHNGPLPRYRGVNIPSWALINGEASHGVVWHRVDAGVDTGEVVARSAFAIDANDTALSLGFKCIRHALALLPDLLHRYTHDDLQAEPVTDEPPSLYRWSDLPNDGLLDPHWPATRIDAFLRGLNFKPFANAFVRPRIALADGVTVCAEYGELVADGSDRTPGAVVDASERSVDVSVRDGRVRLFGLFSAEGDPLPGTELAGTAPPAASPAA